MLLCLSLAARADEEVAPRPYITTAEGGAYRFEMSPSRGGGRGRAYRVSGKAADVLVWSTSGWYAGTTFLSWDGTYLVRIGDWPRGQGPSSRDLAIAFYAKGQLLKSFSTADLIRDPTKIEVSKSHYVFMKGAPGFAGFHTYDFRMVTIDGLEYRFDVRRGEILAARQTAKVKPGIGLPGDSSIWDQPALEVFSAMKTQINAEIEGSRIPRSQRVGPCDAEVWGTQVGESTLVRTVKGDYTYTLYRIEFEVKRVREGTFTGRELVFFAERRYPTPESGIMLEDDWPFRIGGSKAFALQHKPERYAILWMGP